MRQFLSSIVRKLDALSRWSGMVLIMFLFVVVGIMIFEVVSRYVFNRPTIWGFEMAKMVFGPYALGSGAYALLNRSHVRMDIFYTRWPERTKAIVDVCTFPLILLFFVILFWKSTNYGWQSILIREHSVSAWGPPIYYWKLTVPFATLLFALQGISDFIRNLTIAISGKELK